jgi:predicted enzyme related to lactoylglutathione lyase
VVNAVGHFAWYELTTTDFEGARAFYTKVMGWDAWDASAPGRPYILFTSGKATVSGLMDLPPAARQAGAAPCWVGYVAVDDVDATADRIKRRGGAVEVPPTDIPGICRFSVFTDPQTATLGLFKSSSSDHERPPTMDAPGRVGWHELLAADREKAFAFYGELFGWQQADADVGAAGTYQVFSAGGQAIGGILTKPPAVPAPSWLYYFNIDDIDAAAKRVTAGGGQILDGPLELPGGTWIANCTDPQGAVFALQGKRRPNAIGYFERVAPRDPSDARGRRWSW